MTKLRSLTVPRDIRAACSMLGSGAKMVIQRGIMLPAGGELHAELRRQLRAAEREGYVDCVEEGVSEGRRWEAYQLTENGLLVAAALIARGDRLEH